MQDDADQQPTVENLRAIFEQRQSRLNAAKIAYLNASTLDGKEITYDYLKRIAKETIQANYELQKAQYGTVRLKLSVAKLLRRGR